MDPQHIELRSRYVPRSGTIPSSPTDPELEADLQNLQTRCLPCSSRLGHRSLARDPAHPECSFLCDVPSAPSLPDPVWRAVLLRIHTGAVLPTNAQAIGLRHRSHPGSDHGCSPRSITASLCALMGIGTVDTMTLAVNAALTGVAVALYELGQPVTAATSRQVDMDHHTSLRTLYKCFESLRTDLHRPDGDMHCFSRKVFGYMLERDYEAVDRSIFDALAQHQTKQVGWTQSVQSLHFPLPASGSPHASSSASGWAPASASASHSGPHASSSPASRSGPHASPESSPEPNTSSPLESWPAPRRSPPWTEHPPARGTECWPKRMRLRYKFGKTNIRVHSLFALADLVITFALCVRAGQQPGPPQWHILGHHLRELAGDFEVGDAVTMLLRLWLYGRIINNSREDRNGMPQQAGIEYAGMLRGLVRAAWVVGGEAKERLMRKLAMDANAGIEAYVGDQKQREIMGAVRDLATRFWTERAGG